MPEGEMVARNEAAIKVPSQEVGGEEKRRGEERRGEEMRVFWVLFGKVGVLSKTCGCK